ncbi:hypothetical protein K438DRAFT_1945139 [Mycena galopus ATCC 62051]|nr:hypothetical protein K438DRAFT_1945139 [Mycena galopus ATCC 62051]
MNSPATSDSSSSSGSSTAYSSWSPSSQSSSSSPVHPASLVDPARHSPELMQLVDIDLSQPVIHYVVDCVSDAVNYAFGRPATFRSAHSRKFTNFVSNVLSRAEVAPPTLLVALVYISRSRTHLSIALEQWALERVFLGALIIASKYTQDSTLKNVHWGMVTGVFGKGDIGRIEREFLDVIDWQLGVAEADVLAHHEGLVAAAYGVSSASPIPVAAKDIEMEYAPPVPAPAVVEPAHPSPSSGPVPELEPSSPQSSAGTLSPRTPDSHAMSHMDISPHAPSSPSRPPCPRPHLKPPRLRLPHLRLLCLCSYPHPHPHPSLSLPKPPHHQRNPPPAPARRAPATPRGASSATSCTPSRPTTGASTPTPTRSRSPRSPAPHFQTHTRTPPALLRLKT